MAQNAVVRARVSEEVKEEATEVLAEMGLTVSDAVRIMLNRVAKEKALPFELRPNKSTRASMRKSMRGEDLYEAKDLRDLYKHLKI